MFVAIDFDGTIVEHMFPEIGSPVPGAIEWMKKFQEAGAQLILWTMRSDGPPIKGASGDVLTQAVDYCRANGVEFYGVNENPTQYTWTDSPKAYGKIYIDDAAYGCPLIETEGRPYVDWSKVGPAVLEMINDSNFLVDHIIPREKEEEHVVE